MGIADQEIPIRQRTKPFWIAELVIFHRPQAQRFSLGGELLHPSSTVDHDKGTVWKAGNPARLLKLPRGFTLRS